MPFLLQLFTLVLILATGFDLYLRARQMRHVARHRGTVPAGFAASLTLEEHGRAAAYERARLRLGSWSAVYGAVVALGWAWAGYDALYVGVAGFVAPGLSRSVLFLVAAGALSSLLGLPFALWRTFGVEARFGFNRTTLGRFAADRAKGAVVSLVVAGPLLYGLMWLMRQPGAWWIWAWLGCLVLMLVAMDVGPRWIAPLFNKFTPVEGALRVRIEELLQRCGFTAAGLFVMDASRRSGHGNAYFTGFGRSKRIVLFDTLIAGNSEAELEAVLAHELGHYKLRHIWMGLGQTAALLLAGFFAVGWLCHQKWLLRSFGIGYSDDALALVVCVLVVEMVGPLVGVAANWVSRRHEYQADDFARRMVGAEPMASALVRLARENASTLTVDPLYALVNFGHPPVMERVERLRQSIVPG